MVEVQFSTKGTYCLLYCNAVFLHMICRNVCFSGGPDICDMLFEGLGFVTERNRGRRSKRPKFRVTFFMDSPEVASKECNNNQGQ